MLHDKAPREDVFYHISKHADSRIYSDLVETFLLLLLASGDLNALVALVHIVYECDSTHYKLSNQFWSILSSKATLMGHHAAASLVYHEIVNPHKAYGKAWVRSPTENHLVPFLLLPTAIGQLAIVFAQNGNIAAVEGLRAYFNRFYSYFGRRTVYETLTIARVEAQAKSGDISRTLDSFVDLCLKYRGHTRYRDPKDTARSLKYLSHMGYKERKRNITNNIGLGNQKLYKLRHHEAQTRQINLFQPTIEYNVYHKPGKPHWAMLDGCPRVADLPCFQELVREHVQKIVSEQYSVVDRLMTFITRYHHSLHKFVAVSLCEFGHVEVAWAVVSKLPELYPQIPKKVLYSGPEVFCSIFRALRRAYDRKPSLSGPTYNTLDQMLSLVFAEWHQLKTTSSSGRRAYLEALLASPNVSKQEVEAVIGLWKREGLNRVVLDSVSRERILGLGIEDSTSPARAELHIVHSQ